MERRRHYLRVEVGCLLAHQMWEQPSRDSVINHADTFSLQDWGRLTVAIHLNVTGSKLGRGATAQISHREEGASQH